MNDFETIREWFKIGPSVSPFAERALDHIEDRLDDRIQKVSDLVAEVEQLRAAIEDYLEKRIGNDGLRAALEGEEA